MIDATAWALLVIGISVLPLFLYILLQVRSGRMTDIHVGIRRQRYRIYFIALLLMTATLALLAVTPAPATLVPLLLSMLISIGIDALVNFHSKVSLHASAFSGALVVACCLYGRITLILMLPLLLLVMWSRVRLGQHSTGQVLGGALISGSVTATVFAILLV